MIGTGLSKVIWALRVVLGSGCCNAKTTVNIEDRSYGTSCRLIKKS